MSADHPQVLVVEDEPAQREVLAYNLEAEGFRVTRADSRRIDSLQVIRSTQETVASAG